MSREKQIFEVESITNLPCWQGPNQCWCEISCNDCIESHLLAAGYRKQSEVAREIFEDIKDAYYDCIWIDITTRKGCLQETKFLLKLVEIKKKYTEEQK